MGLLKFSCWLLWGATLDTNPKISCNVRLCQLKAEPIQWPLGPVRGALEVQLSYLGRCGRSTCVTPDCQQVLPYVLVEWKATYLSCCGWLVAQSCLTLHDTMDRSPPGSSVHGIFQASVLEWVAIFSSRRSSWPEDWTCVSCLGRQILYTEPSVKPSYLLDNFFRRPA